MVEKEIGKPLLRSLTFKVQYLFVKWMLFEIATRRIALRCAPLPIRWYITLMTRKW
jgi:hypothetical protein